MSDYAMPSPHLVFVNMLLSNAEHSSFRSWQHVGGKWHRCRKFRYNDIIA
jgi:hypothetical protein